MADTEPTYRDPRQYGRFRGRPMSREAAEAIVAAEGGPPARPKATTAQPKTTPKRRPLVPLVPRNLAPGEKPSTPKPKTSTTNAITSESVRKVTTTQPTKPKAVRREEDEVDG